MESIMESEKQEAMQTQQEHGGGDFLSAGSYQEQELGHNNSIGDKGRDECAQAGDFLRGSRGDEPSSALTQVLHDHRHSGSENTSSTTQTNFKPSAAADGEKSGHGVETAKGEPLYLGGDETNGKGVGLDRSPHRMPHQEVPQPGQYTDMDVVVEMVALAEL